jgi:hypothetical protein
MTAILLIIFYALVTSICSIDATQYGMSSNSIFDSARTYFNYQKEVAVTTYAKSGNAIMLASALSSLRVAAPISPSAFGVTVRLHQTVFAGFSAMIGPLQFIMNLVVMNIMISSAQGFILSAIEGSFLALMLPVGVALRCFMPFRNLGGLLISISIGLFLFYPLMFGFFYLLLGQPATPSMPALNWGTYVTAIGLMFVAAVVPGVILPLTVGAVEFALFTSIFLFADMFSSQGTALLVIYILPAIGWIIITSAVRSLSKALGEEVDVSSLARII